MITKEEKNILYWKYRGQGLNSMGARQCVENQVGFLNNLKNKMKKQNKTNDKIGNKFKEEFAKLCEEDLLIYIS